MPLRRAPVSHDAFKIEVASPLMAGARLLRRDSAFVRFDTATPFSLRHHFGHAAARSFEVCRADIGVGARAIFCHAYRRYYEWRRG